MAIVKHALEFAISRDSRPLPNTTLDGRASIPLASSRPSTTGLYDAMRDATRVIYK